MKKILVLLFLYIFAFTATIAYASPDYEYRLSLIESYTKNGYYNLSERAIRSLLGKENNEEVYHYASMLPNYDVSLSLISDGIKKYSLNETLRMDRGLIYLRKWLNNDSQTSALAVPDLEYVFSSNKSYVIGSNLLIALCSSNETLYEKRGLKIIYDILNTTTNPLQQAKIYHNAVVCSSKLALSNSSAEFAQIAYSLDKANFIYFTQALATYDNDSSLNASRFILSNIPDVAIEDSKKIEYINIAIHDLYQKNMYQELIGFLNGIALYSEVENSQIAINKAIILSQIETDNIDTVNTAFEEAINLYPSNPAYYRYYAYYLVLTNSFKKAETMLELALADNNTKGYILAIPLNNSQYPVLKSPIELELASIYRLNGKYNKTIAILTSKNIGTKYKIEQYYNVLCGSYVLVNNLQMATKCYKEGLKEYPSNELYRGSLESIKKAQSKENRELSQINIEKQG